MGRMACRLALLLVSLPLLAGSPTMAPALAAPVNPVSMVEERLRQDYGGRMDSFFFSFNALGPAGLKDFAQRFFVVTKVYGESQNLVVVTELIGENQRRAWELKLSSADDLARTRIERFPDSAHLFVEYPEGPSGADRVRMVILDVSAEPPLILFELKHVHAARSFLVADEELPYVVIVQKPPGPLNGPSTQPPFLYKLYKLRYTGREYLLFDAVSGIQPDPNAPEAKLNNEAVRLYRAGELIRAKDGFERAIEEAQFNPGPHVKLIRENQRMVDYHLDLVSEETYALPSLITSLSRYSQAKAEFLRGNFSNAVAMTLELEKTVGLDAQGVYMLVVSLVELKNWQLLNRYESRIWQLGEQDLTSLMLRILPELVRSDYARFRRYLLTAAKKLGENHPLIVYWKARLLAERPADRDRALRYLRSRLYQFDLDDPLGARAAALIYQLYTVLNRPEDAKKIYQQMLEAEKPDLEPLMRTMEIYLATYPVGSPEIETQPMMTEELRELLKKLEQGD